MSVPDLRPAKGGGFFFPKTIGASHQLGTVRPWNGSQGETFTIMSPVRLEIVFMCVAIGLTVAVAIAMVMFFF